MNKAWIPALLAMICAACNEPQVVLGPRDGGRPVIPPIDGGPPLQNCGLDAPAFCETFDTPHPGGRGGEIDESRFGFSRWGVEIRLEAESFTDGITEYSNPDGPPMMCDAYFEGVLPPDDVRVCGGQLNEAAISGGLPINSFMIRQPFDFADGGTFVFDVDAKRNDGWDGHGWWLEVWVTDEPVPIPYHNAPTVESLPRNGIGFQIAPFDNAFSDLERNEVTGIGVVENYQFVSGGLGAAGNAGHYGPTEWENTFRVRDRMLNRFRVSLSPTRIEIYVTDVDPTSEPRLALAADVEVPFTIGYLHFQHVHYNAQKTPNCDCQDGDDCPLAIQECVGGVPLPDEEQFRCCWAHPNGIYASATQVYRWDNIGFDGPVYPRLRSYDVPDQGGDRVFTDEDGTTSVGRVVGYRLYEGTDDPASFTFTLEGVDLRDAVYASLNFSYATRPGTPIHYRFNGNAWHEYAVPTDVSFDPIVANHAVSVDAPLTELIDGTNVIDFEGTDDDSWMGNIDLTIHPAR